jgi:catechol 2,3-dioxygenase-like lactoylglutathione lyase family enzyme
MHVSVNVTDVARSVTFYEALFGVPVNKVRPGYANFDLSNPPLKFALNAHPFRERGALNHLGFQVQTTEEVLAAKARLEQSGLVTFDEMDTTCC